MVIKMFTTLILAIILSGCKLLNPPHPDDPKYAPVDAAEMLPPRNTTGGIYQEGYAMALFETIRAKGVGDILTIILEEKTSAKKKAATSGKKDNETNIEDPTLFGKKIKFGSGHNLSFNLKANRDFDGEGESEQNNTLSGTIAVTVAEVLPNGNMVIRGEKWITLNQGDEYIRLKGIVRPSDITPDNTVPSYKVANARITYSGIGQVADTNVMGWLARFFMTGFWGF